ncbi:MAG: SAM-dependent methyltransferase [Frankia sp.]
MTPARLVGVGVGPGDPELVTVKAVRILTEADVVFVPVSDAVPGRPYDGGVTVPGSPRGLGETVPGSPRGLGETVPRSPRGLGDDAHPDGPGAAGEPGRAEATVRTHVTHDRIVRLPFQMTGAADYDGPAVLVANALVTRPGGTVAFATIGDPNIYSTFTALAAAVRRRVPDVRIETVPGITAMQDLAARSGTVLAVGTETVALLPLTAGVDVYARAIDEHDTVVAYKGGRALPRAIEVLGRAGRLGLPGAPNGIGAGGAATYGAGLGLPGEDIRPVGELDPRAPGPYLSTVIATRRPPWPT